LGIWTRILTAPTICQINTGNHSKSNHSGSVNFIITGWISLDKMSWLRENTNCTSSAPVDQTGLSGGFTVPSASTGFTRNTKFYVSIQLPIQMETVIFLGIGTSYPDQT
jgi:hypothetical protein